MTKAPVRKGRKALEAKQAESISLFDAVTLTTIDLFRAELRFVSPESSSSITKGEIEYTCKVPILRSSSETDIAIVNFMASRPPSQMGGEEVEIGYVCVFRRKETNHSFQEVKDFYSHFIRHTVWQKGRELMLTFISQGNLSMPTPPMYIPGLEWEAVYEDRD